MGTMNKKAIVLLAALIGGGAVWAAAPVAKLQSLKGKVEVKVVGGAWVAATEGQVLNPADTLSTGFDSSAVVVMDKTTVQVKPLTRMTIDKLVEDGGTVKTSTFLRVGNVSVSVKSAEGVKQDFKVQSPYSTASVRGTEFEYDGLSLKVKEGIVAFILGRLARESSAPPPPSDYAGAPDVAANPDKAIPVTAGKDAQIVVSFTGDSTTKSSDDKDSLQKDSGIPSTPPIAPPPPPTKGTVKLTIKVAP
jgi:hypothetical protein